MSAHRQSDRWITPGVVCVGIVVAGLVVLGIAGLVAWLSAHHDDPTPMLHLAAETATAAGSLGTLGLSLVSRRTVARTERNTGWLANAVADVAEAMPRPVLRNDDGPGASGRESA